MTSLHISPKILESCFVDSSFTLEESHLKTSQLIQSFFEQATELAPLAGMMIGNFAAPFIRFQSSRLLAQVIGKERGFRSISYIGSWLCGASVEGLAMAATPALLRGENLGVELWRQVTHSTLTMMVCEGISKRMSLRGRVLGACSQDLGVMLVNWGCGELSITEKTQGGIIGEWTEARITSMRIGMSASLIRTTFTSTASIRANYELQYKKENESVQIKKIGQVQKGFLNAMSERMKLIGNRDQFAIIEGFQEEMHWESDIQKIIQSSPYSFMGRKDNRYGGRDKKLGASTRQRISRRSASPSKILDLSFQPNTPPLPEGLLQATRSLLQTSNANILPTAEEVLLRSVVYVLASDFAATSLFRSSDSPVSSGARKSSPAKPLLAGLPLGEYLSLPRTARSFVSSAIYELIKKTNIETLKKMSMFGKAIPPEFVAQESFDFALSAYSNDTLLPFTSPENFTLDFGRSIAGKPFHPSTTIEEAIERFQTSRMSVSTLSGMNLLAHLFTKIYPEAQIVERKGLKTKIVIPTSTGLNFTLIIRANRVIKRVDLEEGISMKEMLRLQDEENDFANVLLVKRRDEDSLIIRGAASRGGLSILPGDLLLAHTHPWQVENLIHLTPGKSEIKIAHQQKNIQAGLYRNMILIFHSNTRILPTTQNGEFARRGNITFIPVTGEDDFYISTKEDNVFIRPDPRNVKTEVISVHPIAEVTFRNDGKPHTFNDGEKEIDESQLLKHLEQKTHTKKA